MKICYYCKKEIRASVYKGFKLNNQQKYAHVICKKNNKRS